MSPEERVRDLLALDLGTTMAEFAMHLTAAIREAESAAERRRDEEYRKALGMEFADGSPLLMEYMTPQLAGDIFKAMRESTDSEEAERRGFEHGRDAAAELLEWEGRQYERADIPVDRNHAKRIKAIRSLVPPEAAPPTPGEQRCDSKSDQGLRCSKLAGHMGEHDALAEVYRWTPAPSSPEGP